MMKAYVLLKNQQQNMKTCKALVMELIFHAVFIVVLRY